MSLVQTDQPPPRLNASRRRSEDNGALATPLGPGARITITYGTLLAVGALVMWTAAAIHDTESQLDRAATHAPLTGLANRTLIARRAASLHSVDADAR